MTRTKAPTLPQIQSELETIRRTLEEERVRIDELNRQAKALMARGTRDNVVAPVDPDRQQLIAQLMKLMAEAPRSLKELVDETKERPAHISNVLTSMRKAGHHVINVGEPRRARWYYVPKLTPAKQGQ